ncbi:hypothetical protein C8J56DRAFT_1022443 [Mycena floridula]|nr:hypothetical protein C8J56DRAFT_1022443 [Mycena floridula]
MSAPAFIPSDFLGSQLFGSLFNFSLYGVLAVQVYVYHLSFPEDNVKIRALVYFVILLETAQTVLNGIDAFNWFAKGFGNPLAVLNAGLSWIYTPLMDGVISLIVQLFFCYRIWVINNSALFFSIFIACLSLLQGGGAFASAAKAEMIHDYAQAAVAGKVSVTIWLAAGALTDVLIAAAMSYSLLRARSGASRRSNDIISRVVQLTVETNAITTIVAVVSLALYKGYPNKTYFLGPTMILGKLYSNTLLLTFNNRAYLNNNSTVKSTNYSVSATANARASPKAGKFAAGLSMNRSEPTSTLPIPLASVKNNHSNYIPRSPDYTNESKNHGWHSV